MSSRDKDRRLARRKQTGYVDSSLVRIDREYNEDEEDEEDDRGRCRGKIRQRSPLADVPLVCRSMLANALGIVAIVCCGIVVLVVAINLLTNWNGSKHFSWTALDLSLLLMKAGVYGLIGAGGLAFLWVLLNKILLSFAKNLKEIFCPSPEILGMNNNFIAYTGKNVQVHDHQDNTTAPEFESRVWQARRAEEQYARERLRRVQLEEQMEEERQKRLPPQVEVPQIGQPEECINLSPHYQMHVDELLSHRGFLLGTSGAGKSSTTAVIVEGLIEKDVPYVVFDTEGEYLQLPSHMGRGHTIDSSTLESPYAENFGRWVIANHQQVVLNLLSYDPTQAAQVMIGVITGIKQWEEERGNEHRVAIMTFLTEAHRWFPQQQQENQLPPEIYAELMSIFFADLVRRGRKRGMGMAFDTQKLQEVDKRILQPDWKICLRQTEDRSLARYKQWGILPEEAMTLRNGEGFIFSSRVHKLKAQMNMRRSPDDSKSPGLESIRNHRPESDAIWTPREYSPFTQGGFDRQTGPLRRTGVNSVNEVNEPVEHGEGIGEYGEYSRPLVNNSPQKVNVSSEERAAILAAARAQLAETGKVNRTKLRDSQGWNNKMWDKIKQVLDEEGL